MSTRSSALIKFVTNQRDTVGVRQAERGEVELERRYDRRVTLQASLSKELRSGLLDLRQSVGGGSGLVVSHS
jgi:hypothetical protein